MFRCRLAKLLFDLSKPNEAYIVMENFKEKFPEFASNSSCKVLRKEIKKAISSGKFATAAAMKQACETTISDYEKKWRQNAIDFKLRLCGHCNTITDIKEANFFGE